jgi:hypothetical protein
LDTGGGAGSVAGGESWWFPFVRLVCDSISVDTRVDTDSTADCIELRVDFGLLQRLKGADKARLGRVFGKVAK